jgi:hypothetical protein
LPASIWGFTPKKIYWDILRYPEISCYVCTIGYLKDILSKDIPVIFTIDCTLLASSRHLASAGCWGAALEPAGFIFTTDCTLLASARHLASAGYQVAARGEPVCFIFTTDYTLLAFARHLATAGCRPAVGGLHAGSLPASSSPSTALARHLALAGCPLAAI